MARNDTGNTTLDELEQRLLDDYQRDLPVAARPFAAIAGRLGCSEAEVIDTLKRLSAAGVVSRVGPVFRPHRVGCSTLAAMAVPRARLEEVAALVNGFAEVNHNYEREHRFNLWFVVTAADDVQVTAVLDQIESLASLPVICLPMLEAYHIDLGFPLQGQRHCAGGAGSIPRAAPAVEPVRRPLSIRDPGDLRLVAAIQQGLPLIPRPYAAIAHAAALTEQQVCNRLAEWLRDGTIGRLGIVVRHRELGYRANAMVVWDVPDGIVSELGTRFSRYDFVTLCYQRRRSLPDWRYNLFCMIHGRDREAVEERVQLLVKECGLTDVPHALLFSTRRFKQRGAHYVIDPPAPEARVNHG